MRAKHLIIPAIGVLLALSPAADPSASADTAGAPELSPGARDITVEEARRTMDLIFRDHRDLGLAYLDSLKSTCDGHPLYLLMRGRVLQEHIPLDDGSDDYSRTASEPALAAFDRCIEVCTRRMDAGDGDAILNLYRGWAWMSKSYIRSLSRDMWDAGRDAKRGRQDLQLYLTAYPDDPMANGLMGSFLYFADIIPSIFKFFSKLFGMPTGDRKRGLDHLEHAVHLGGGVLATDWKLILYQIYFYFEGRHEAGLEGFQAIISEYPDHARNALPMAVSRPYAPHHVERLDARISEALGRTYQRPADEVEWDDVFLLEAFQAHSDRVYAPSRSLARFKRIIQAQPRHPDWMQGYARFEMGRLYAAQGRREEALALLESVGGAYKDPAQKVIKDIAANASFFEKAVVQPSEQWIDALYSGHPDSLARVRGNFERMAKQSLPARFYLAEAQLLAGESDKARDTYRKVVDTDAPAWDDVYRMIAASRTGELYAVDGKYKKASRYVERALEFYNKEYLIDWFLEGRRDYFKRLHDGEESVAPTLLSKRR